MEKSFSYRDKLYTLVENAMTPQLIRSMNQEMMKYMDKNSDILKSVDFSKQLTFSEKLKDQFNGYFGITPKLVKQVAKESGYIDASWKVLTTPIFVTLTCIIMYHLKNKDEKSARLTSYFLAMPMFSSVMYRQFPEGVIKEVMDYTIENLSQKYLIKQTGSIFGMLAATCDTIIASYKTDLLEMEDKEGFYKFISGMKTRIGKNVINIAEEYYKNYKSKNYLNSDSDSMDEDNYRIVSSDTMKVSGLARKVVMNITTIGYDSKIIRMAKNLSRDVSLNTLNGILDNIAQNHKEELNEFIIRCIEILYIKGYSIDDAKLPKYLSIAVEAYRSNSDDPTLNYIKARLGEWININTSTKHNYQRSVFYTFILTIQKEAKGGEY